MEKYPLRHRNHEIESLSERFLRQQLPISWVLNAYQKDYGTDFDCEITTERRVTGNNFSIQLKGKETEKNSEFVKISLKRSNINRWLNRLEPTMIVVYIVDEDEAYWKWMESTIIDLTLDNETYTISIPRENSLRQLNWNLISDNIKSIFSKRHLLYDIPKVDDENERAWDSFYSNNFEQALSEFYKILKRSPTDVLVLEAIAIAEYNLFNYQKALVYINKAIGNKNINNFNLTKASILTEQGFLNNEDAKIIEAIKIYQDLIKADFVTDILYYNYASAQTKLKDYEAAIDNFQKSLELNPNKPETWNNLGNCYLNIGKHDLEMICYDKALTVNPNLAETLFSKGSSLFRFFGDVDEGLELMLKATELSDRHEMDNPYVFFWIAEAYFFKKDFVDAKQWNNKGLLYFSSDDYLIMQKARFENLIG